MPVVDADKAANGCAGLRSINAPQIGFETRAGWSRVHKTIHEGGRSRHRWDLRSNY